jgi:flagellin-like protein
MNRLLRNRKGISPVVGAVLMIVVTIIGMSFLFAYAVNYATDFQLGRGSAVRESLVIENGYWNETSTTADIWVYNVGEIDLEIANVYVNDIKADIIEIDDVPVSEQTLVTVPVGEHVKIGVTKDSLDADANVQLYNLVTARGSSVEGRY